MGKKLYVGNLTFDVTDKDLEALFSQAGAIQSVAVITDKFSGQSRGFGFVEMSSNAEAQAAIQQFNGQELKGRTLKVNEARDRDDRGGSGGGGGTDRHSGASRNDGPLPTGGYALSARGARAGATQPQSAG